MASCKTVVCLGRENICKNCIKEDVCKIAEDFYKKPVYGMYIEDCDYFKDRIRFVELPCTVKDLIDKVIGHNEIVAIWERRKNKEGRYNILLWRGMAWDIPEEYLDRTFLKIFGTVPKSITEADTVNIAVTPILISAEEAEQSLKERNRNDKL